jgi:hypothetical protein
MPTGTQQWHPIGPGAIRAAVEAKRRTPRTGEQQQQQGESEHEVTPQMGADDHGPRRQR